VVSEVSTSPLPFLRWGFFIVKVYLDTLLHNVNL
jgi:hypothetical protein